MGRASRARAQAEPGIDANRLVNGWSGPGGTVLRLARPGDIGRVGELADVAGGPLEDYMRNGISDGSAAVALLEAVRVGANKPLLGNVVRAMTSDSGPQPFVEMSMVLVAERDGEVVGAVYSLPPMNFISQILDAGVDPSHALMCALAAAKVKALAVDPAAAGAGIASALLRAAVQVYDRAGFHLVYGSFNVGSGLERFYAARSFEILPAGTGVPMYAILGSPAMLAADPGEQMFARWR